MTPELRTYDEFAQDILRDYLRSAVIIDDQWPATPVAEETSEYLDESKLIDDREPDGAGMEDVEMPLGDVPPPRPPDNPADARLLADLQRSLLQEGLLTCGFRYTHQSRDVAVELARRADIVVLDWHLVNDDGADALAILEELRGDELRFVCIFTGHGLIREVRHALSRLGEVASEAGEADLRIANLVIAIRNKQGGKEEAPNLTVEPAGLLTAALRGLAGNYNGLVQLAMLELTRQHRRHLPAILDRLDRSIDRAVLLEVGDESSPVGQGGAFLSVLVDEWRAHLEQEHLRLRVLGPEGRRLFGARMAERLNRLSEADMEKALTSSAVKQAGILASPKNRAQLQEWLVGGCEGGPAVEGVKLKDEDDQSRLAAWGILQATSDAIEDKGTLPLLRLDVLFHQQFELPEKLTQGTLVAVDRSESEVHYYLCISPACDAERPAKIGNLFSFLRTKRIPDEDLLGTKKKTSGYCAVKDGERLLCLEIFLKERVVLEVKERTFDENGVVAGCLTLGDGKTSEPIRLRRVAQLRAEQALSITAAAAADSSRVGVNRVELIRRRRPNP